MTSFGDFNLYEELDITKEATPEVIKKAYKKMAMKWHPDKNSDDPNATEKFQRISHAYTILSDPKKKQYYDKYGKIDEDNFNYEEFMKNFNFNDIFSEMFSNPNMFDNKFVQFVNPSGGAFDGRHSMKLMFQRKKATNMPYSMHPDPVSASEGELPKFIYGKGRGLDSKVDLEKWDQTNDDEWTTDDETDDNNEADDNEEENLLDIFIEDSVAPIEDGKFICRYCEARDPNATIDSQELRKHFIEHHKSQFEEYFGPEAKWEEAIKEKKKSSKSNKKPGMQFMNFDDMFGGMGGGMPFGMGGGMPFGMGGGMPFGMGGGMPFGMGGGMPMDMGSMGQMFGMSQADTEQMMKDMEKMFGGMGMGFPGPK